MAEVEIICMANSYKYGGRCIAGLRTDGGGWVRPVADTSHGELLPEHYTLHDGSEAQVLDVIRLNIENNTPEPHQPENWRMGQSPWELVSRPMPQEYYELLESSLLTGPHLFNDATDSDRISFDSFNEVPAKSSLELIAPENLRWRIKRTSKERLQARAIFDYKGSEYDLVVTDPVWREILQTSLQEGVHSSTSAGGLKPEDRVIFTLSLGEPYERDNCCYKLVASVIILSEQAEVKKDERDERSSLAVARRLLMTHFGHKDFLPGQEQALGPVFSGKNLLVVMPTGSGKSLIYQLPAFMDDGLTIVVSPLISLMKDQVDELQRIGVSATFVNSSLGRDEQRSRLSGCLNGEYRILYIAPERCRNKAFLRMLARTRISRLAIDEAHCISEWGHDFRPDYRRLRTFHDHIGSPPITALTATATSLVQQDIIESLGFNPDQIDVHVHGFDRPNLKLSVIMAFNDEKKIGFLSEFLTQHKGSGIIYAGTRKSTEDLVQQLKTIEPSMVAYHAGMEPEERSRAQEAFLSGKARVVVATSAFGMGIDKPDVRFVIHYNYPGSVEQYYQEIGRAGRDGLESQCILLYSSADQALREFFIDVNYPSKEQIKSVCKTLWETADNPVLLTYREIARLCDESINEGQVGSAIRILSNAGVVRAFSGEPKVAVAIDKPYSKIKPLIRGPMQQRVLEAIADFVDLEAPGRFEVGIHQLASGAGASLEQVRRALVALRDSGIIKYEPPFRGRGIEKLVDPPPPFGILSIDWGRHQMLRRVEEERLLAMERFINYPGCRREYILLYFGEKESFACGICDNCREMESGEEVKRTMIQRSPNVALPVLACLRFARFPIGKGRVAEVVTGSRNKQLLEWHLDQNPAYGLVDLKQGDVKEIIEHLILEGYIDQKVEEGFPLLGLTALGRNEARGLTPDRLQGLLAKKDDRPRLVSRSSRVSSDAETRIAVLKSIDTVPFPLGVTKIAAVLTGSKAKWIRQAEVDELEVYGTVDATQDHVREVIDGMIDEDVLKRGGKPDRPTLEITTTGKTELERYSEVELSPIQQNEERQGVDRPLPVRETADHAAAFPSTQASLDRRIRQLLLADFKEAKNMVRDFEGYNPVDVLTSLRKYSIESNKRRIHSRVVWAVGELCGESGVEFLVGCAASDDDNIRKLAASALGKAAKQMNNSEPPNRVCMEKAVGSLKILMKDRVKQVRQYAKKSLRQFR